MRLFQTCAIAVALAWASVCARADELPLVRGTARQPLVESTQRLMDALQFIGAPLAKADLDRLQAALGDAGSDVELIVQQVLDPYCLAGVDINAESRVQVLPGPARAELLEQGWRAFLVKVHNQAGITPQLKAESPNAAAMVMQGKGARQRLPADGSLVTPAQSLQRFLELSLFDSQPLRKTLSGLAVEYRILQLYSRDAGEREAQLSFNVGQGTQDLGFRNSVPILFHCLPAYELRLSVKDDAGAPTIAAFVVKDRFGRVYPAPSRRLAPDFFFHQQVYRGDGETLKLPAGEFTATISRGPEFLPVARTFSVGPDQPQILDVQLQRWIHPAARGWYSGDHHVHAAGCAHYDSPTEGVRPEDMLRHIVGEDLNVGCVLSWGPCWYAQKQFFEGKTSALSQPNYLMRYDIEVSGFPSSHAGHLCLLRLSEDDYPGTKVLEDWPSWTLPVLTWGQSQGAVVGYSHSGWGLALPDYGPGGERLDTIKYGANPAAQKGRAAQELPDYAMPKFDGIGANEYIVAAALGACDFISTVDTPAIWELNIWYHTLNCGLTTRISGETDFPCIYGDRVGLGRVYVQLPKDAPLAYDAWVHGIKDGRSYCGDGLSHVFDFQINGVSLGERRADGAVSRVDVEQPGTPVKLSFQVAALLAETPSPETEAIRNKRLDEKPYWHIERRRIGNTRKVPVEIIRNGSVAATIEIEADGKPHTIEQELNIPWSSWVAVRILPSVHTNPIFVHVAGQPIRHPSGSAKWCRDAVEVCWKSKSQQIRPAEHDAAKAAYDQAQAFYEKVEREAQGAETK